MSRVSVVLTHYSDCHLQDALYSLKNQTFADLDIYVIDDCSEDDAWIEQTKKLGFKERIKVFKSDRNVGTYRLKNRIIEYTDSEYIAFHDSDDLSMPKRIEMQVNKFNRSKRLGLLGTSYYEIGDDGGITFRRAHKNLLVRSKLGMRYSCLHPTWLIKRELFDKLGGFDGTTRIGADDDFFYRALLCSKVENMAEALYKKRVHQSSLTQSSNTGFFSKVRLDYKCKIENKIKLLKSLKKGELDEYIQAESNDIDFCLKKIL